MSVLQFKMDDIEKIFDSMDNETLHDIFPDDFKNSTKLNFFQGRPDPTTQTVLISAFVPLAVVTLVCNIVVCYVVGKNKKMRTVTNVFIVNMSVSDLILIFLNVPLNIARHVSQEWALGDFLCYMLNFSLMLSTYVSTFTLTAIALDRHQVLLYPLQPRITKRISFVIIFAIWFLSILLALPYGFFTKVAETNFIFAKLRRCTTVFPQPAEKWEQALTISTAVLQFFLPVGVIAIAYIRVIQKLWLRTHLGVVTETQRRMEIQKKRKTIKLLVAVVIVFTVCWAPINFYHLLTDLHPNRIAFKYSSAAFFVCHWIAIASSCINPILYCWMNQSFRAEIKRHVTCLRCTIKKRNCSHEVDDPYTRETNSRIRHERIRRSLSNPLISSSSSDSRRSERELPKKCKFTCRCTYKLRNV
ncbi:G-protein coupled receptor 83-like [Saccostrea echinata]|uniref:G-protein coupled receptor 83-like n=1 Tax=Saccostrea echinata TaxID=191078 RepID=UPI002A7FDBA4|nr:G-protein coupled receptor 83-like [Saccostrea echinata]